MHDVCDRRNDYHMQARDQRAHVRLLRCCEQGYATHITAPPFQRIKGKGPMMMKIVQSTDLLGHHALCKPGSVHLQIIGEGCRCVQI